MLASNHVQLIRICNPFHAVHAYSVEAQQTSLLLNGANRGIFVAGGKHDTQRMERAPKIQRRWQMEMHSHKSNEKNRLNRV